MKIWIIEDEPTLAQSLIAQLRQIRSDIEIVGTSSKIDESIDAIHAHQDIDIIFADIVIDDGTSFSVFDTIKTSAMVVFTTAYNDYALKAFEYNCADYLLKPIRTEDLNRALLKCEQRQERLSYVSLRAMIAEINRGGIKYRERLLLRVGGNITRIIPVRNLAYLNTDLGYTQVYMKDGDVGLTDTCLRALSESLDPMLFCRISRQTIVNINFVEKIMPGPGRDYIVSLGPPFGCISFKISPKRAKELVLLLET